MTVTYKFYPFNHDYQVGDDGSVRTCLVHRSPTRKGAWRCIREVDGRRRVSVRNVGLVQAPHMVLQTFVGPRPSLGHQACHFPDRDTRNNRLSNLRWGTVSSNHYDKRIHGTMYRGSEHHAAKLTEADVAYILAEAKKAVIPGKKARRYGWMLPITRKYGVTKRVVTTIVNGRSWHHVPRDSQATGKSAAGRIVD